MAAIDRTVIVGRETRRLTMIRVLVAYATKHGATAELAEEIGAVLESAGLTADVRPVGDVADVSRYDAVVLGSAIYAGRWRRDAVRFLKHHRWGLHLRPVWLFHDGPLAESAGIPQPLPQRVRGVARSIGATNVKTFGGKLDADTPGFVASRVAKRYGGDYRDTAVVRDWARSIAEELLAREYRRVV
jgi:menaquinone-dependent protoporphyrinogen oxidase